MAEAQPPRYIRLSPGDPVPWFVLPTSHAERYHFAAAAGRYLLLCLHGTARDQTGQAMLSLAQKQRKLFDDRKLSFFSLSADPEDRTRLAEQIPGIRHFTDATAEVSRALGAFPLEGSKGAYRRMWLLIDPDLRLREVVPATDADGGLAAITAILKALPAVTKSRGFEVQAPVLVLPRVFEPELCRQLISLHETDGGKPSGFMREVDGRTVMVMDNSHKTRSDFLIEDQALISHLQAIVLRRVVPEITRAHQFTATRMERYLVGCYDAQTGGHFNAHRDNTTRGTAHRRFAVSINLNADFDGGEVSFPEFSPKGFKAPPGAAVVFSCSLLHEVSPVTRGRRFAFLPFLYDEPAARLREANAAHVEGSASEYRVAG